MAGRPVWERAGARDDGTPSSVQAEIINRRDMELGSQVLLKRILETGKTHGPLPQWARGDVLNAMKGMHL